MRRIILAAVLLGTCAAATAAEPVFGPVTFERTSGAPDVYLETVDVPAGGDHVLYLRNGDAAGGGATAVAVRLDGVELIGPSDLDSDDPGRRVPVELDAGTVELQVELAGEPGSFVTIAIAPRGAVPVFAHGRLVLPWARHGDDVALGIALKNGSTRWPRAVRVVFFAPSGEPLAAGPRLVVPPRGSLVLPVGPLVDATDWTAGSVEVYYAGRGPARVFGDARGVGLATGFAEVVPLEAAGHRVFDGLPDGPPAAGRLGR